MSECGVCKSKIKSLLYCNGCFQRAKSVAERRGRVEEIKKQNKWYAEAKEELTDYINQINSSDKSSELRDFGCQVVNAIREQFTDIINHNEKRLLELEKGDLK